MELVHQRLEDLCAEVEWLLKSRLRGPLGHFVLHCLPQVWVFRTEIGACSVVIDARGNIRVRPGEEGDKDVVLIWKHDKLESFLRLKEASEVVAWDYPEVQMHTDKGRDAFNYLRKGFGL